MATATPTPLKKSELLSELAESTGLTKKAVAAFLDTFVELAYKETKKNGVFVIPGLGKLVKRNRPKRKGRNPATGEAIQIPAKTVVKFNLSKTCKDAVVPPKK
ncbi:MULTISPECIES: HU family DNA-binding protein [Leptospira]|uniref:Viral histone-like protein n=2 Tax=Leptospira TaxID=171 RepID=A0A4R9LVC8_9LEPT|nr:MULTISPECIES: HU family DNA-binding protein [Leptospira]TGN14540.1 HU family DNA-binding protein [Leptospira ilyithenensis]BDA80769.1 DNA-binding protein [Leptospira kobayashii]